MKELTLTIDDLEQLVLEKLKKASLKPVFDTQVKQAIYYTIKDSVTTNMNIIEVEELGNSEEGD